MYILPITFNFFSWKIKLLKDLTTAIIDTEFQNAKNAVGSC